MLRRIVIVATSFTLLLGVSAGALATYAYQKYNGQLKRVNALQLHDTNIRKPQLQLNAENFLIIGSDTRAGQGVGYGNEAGARSDTTILVHLSAGHRRATIISFPRDSWVQIPSCKAADGSVVAAHQELFNSAFSVGGPTCTIATVQLLTGLAVTHFIEIDFSGFKDIVNALGTVTMCSPVAVDDPESKLHLHPGNNPLDGTQALAYVRARYTIGDGSDLGRIKRQQMFLGTVLRKALSGSLLSDPIALTHFLDAATKAITIDRGTTFGDLRKLATSLSGLNPKRVVFYTAPIANRDYSPPGTAYSGKVQLDAAKGRVLYDSIINDTDLVTPKPSTSSSTTPASKPSTSSPAADTNAGDVACSLG